MSNSSSRLIQLRPLLKLPRQRRSLSHLQSTAHNNLRLAMAKVLMLVLELVPARVVYLD